MNPNKLNSLIGKKVLVSAYSKHFGLKFNGTLNLNKWGRYYVMIALTPITINFSLEDVEDIEEDNIYIKQ